MVVGVHDFRQHCKLGALGVPISATRGLLNNSDLCPRYQEGESEASSVIGLIDASAE